jgi:hypothetical protein
MFGVVSVVVVSDVTLGVVYPQNAHFSMRFGG